MRDAWAVRMRRRIALVETRGSRKEHTMAASPHPVEHRSDLAGIVEDLAFVTMLISAIALAVGILALVLFL
jgi:hypothetical protein